MRPRFSALCAAALAAISVQAADSVVYQDAETGFTFSEYHAEFSIGRYMTFRIAVPSPAQANQPYDAVIQVAAPVQVGWAGLAWGGTMVQNPLSVSWANGQSAIVSSRIATGHSTPTPYAGASYQILKTGTHVNSSYWQVTAKCTGCTSYTGSSGMVYLNPTGSNRLAFAYSRTKPSSPSSNTSTIMVHEVTNYWSHDFAAAANTAFVDLVAKNA